MSVLKEILQVAVGRVKQSTLPQATPPMTKAEDFSIAHRTGNKSEHHCEAAGSNFSLHWFRKLMPFDATFNALNQTH